MVKFTQYFLLILLISFTYNGVVNAASTVDETVIKTVIKTENAPKAVGPYSQGILVKNTLYLAGQIAINPATGKMNNGSIEEQTRQVLDNIKAVVTAAGMSMENIVQAQVFITDLNNYKKMNKIYAEYFIRQPPARAAVEVKRLPLDAKIEIMVIAVR